ncbi:MAG: histidinol dehydrogenase [Thermoanaerobaculia bacterium]
MTLRIVRSDSGRGRRLLERLRRRGDGLLDERVLKRTRKIVKAVREGGDSALLAAVRQYDGVACEAISELRLSSEATADEPLPDGFEGALERAITAVERYHREQIHGGCRIEENGVELVERRRPLRRVAVYVPGGRAAYPSTAVMTVIPARLAGVEEIAVATPPGSWQRNPVLRFALERLGVEEVWGMGGAHAVAAFAYGTESVRRADKIVGPGNAWVTTAKHLVSGAVAIDSLAGPSEVVIVAGGAADPGLVAADLLAQAEHDPQALALLVTDHRRLAKAVVKEVDRQLADLDTAPVATASIRDQGAAVVVKDMDEALSWVEEIAPEHLQLIGDGAEALAERVDNAAAVFVGAATPVVFGDYLAGPSHVLPTAGTARFSSALGVEDFVRRSHQVRFTAAAAARRAAPAAKLAEIEGLPAHAASARLRMEPGDGG